MLFSYVCFVFVVFLLFVFFSFIFFLSHVHVSLLLKLLLLYREHTHRNVVGQHQKKQKSTKPCKLLKRKNKILLKILTGIINSTNSMFSLSWFSWQYGRLYFHFLNESQVWKIISFKIWDKKPLKNVYCMKASINCKCLD